MNCYECIEKKESSIEGETLSKKKSTSKDMRRFLSADNVKPDQMGDGERYEGNRRGRSAEGGQATRHVASANMAGKRKIESHGRESHPKKKAKVDTMARSPAKEKERRRERESSGTDVKRTGSGRDAGGKARAEGGEQSGSDSEEGSETSVVHEDAGNKPSNVTQKATEDEETGETQQDSSESSSEEESGESEDGSRESGDSSEESEASESVQGKSTPRRSARRKLPSGFGTKKFNVVDSMIKTGKTVTVNRKSERNKGKMEGKSTGKKNKHMETNRKGSAEGKRRKKLAKKEGEKIEGQRLAKRSTSEKKTAKRSVSGGSKSNRKTRPIKKQTKRKSDVPTSKALAATKKELAGHSWWGLGEDTPEEIAAREAEAAIKKAEEEAAAAKAAGDKVKLSAAEKGKQKALEAKERARKAAERAKRFNENKKVAEAKAKKAKEAANLAAAKAKEQAAREKAKMGKKMSTKRKASSSDSGRRSGLRSRGSARSGRSKSGALRRKPPNKKVARSSTKKFIDDAARQSITTNAFGFPNLKKTKAARATSKDGATSSGTSQTSKNDPYLARLDRMTKIPRSPVKSRGGGPSKEGQRGREKHRSQAHEMQRKSSNKSKILRSKGSKKKKGRKRVSKKKKRDSSDSSGESSDEESSGSEYTTPFKRGVKKGKGGITHTNRIASPERKKVTKHDVLGARKTSPRSSPHHGVHRHLSPIKRKAAVMPHTSKARSEHQISDAGPSEQRISDIEQIVVPQKEGKKAIISLSAAKDSMELVVRRNSRADSDGRSSHYLRCNKCREVLTQAAEVIPELECQHCHYNYIIPAAGHQRGEYVDQSTSHHLNDTGQTSNTTSATSTEQQVTQELSERFPRASSSKDRRSHVSQQQNLSHTTSNVSTDNHALNAGWSKSSKFKSGKTKAQFDKLAATFESNLCTRSSRSGLRHRSRVLTGGLTQPTPPSPLVVAAPKCGHDTHLKADQQSSRPLVSPSRKPDDEGDARRVDERQTRARQSGVTEDSADDERESVVSSRRSRSANRSGSSANKERRVTTRSHQTGPDRHTHDTAAFRKRSPETQVFRRPKRVTKLPKKATRSSRKTFVYGRRPKTLGIIHAKCRHCGHTELEEVDSDGQFISRSVNGREKKASRRVRPGVCRLMAETLCCLGADGPNRAYPDQDIRRYGRSTFEEFSAQ